MTIRGKYIGKRKIEIDQDLDLSPDTEIFLIIEEIKPIKQAEENKREKEKKENPWLEIAKIARPIGRSDLSVRHHEILGDVIE